jgi:hypothetical protein
MLREFVTSQILRRVIAMADVPAAEAPIRAALVASQMIGLGLARFVLKIEPLASADIETVVATIGPNVQRYLTGPLPMAARGNAEVDVPAPATE